ncbi:MAG: helix-turn-helix transcriptional regulator, partial [Acidimicrobiales bacterium]|nr:helix-turn-helix transcriptional regulator [Acidimicrobiales bacterium]
MSEIAGTPRDRRRRETTAEILDAAWRLSRRDGLGSVSLRDLGREVGLRASSLYAYFDSKAALYDAMFRQGQEQL